MWPPHCTETGLSGPVTPCITRKSPWIVRHILSPSQAQAFLFRNDVTDELLILVMSNPLRFVFLPHHVFWEDAAERWRGKLKAVFIDAPTTKTP